VFWVHASTQARFEEAYRDIADRLELPGRDDPKASVLRLVHDWLRDEANGRWVMVVDNVDDVETFFPSRQHQHQHQGDEADASAQIPLANYLPQSRNGALLVTSRSKDAASRLVGGYNKIKEVLAMDEGEGLQLLRNKLQDAPLEESAVGLLHALDCIPLAITQAAAYINQHGRMTVAGYLDEYRKSSKRRERLLSWDAGALRRDRSASNSVMATWQMSFEQIRHERRSAAELLSLMSFFKPQGIPESVLRRHSREAARGVGLEDNKDADSAFDEDLATLQAYSLVSMTADSDTCEMHALVQFCTRVWLSSFSEAERWQGEFIELMAREFPSGKYENWAKCQQLLPHIEPLFDTQPADEVALKAWARVLTNAAWYLRLRGNYEVAELTATKASAAAELIFGTDNEVTLTSWNELANILQDRGKYKHAESLHRRVLEEREKIFGPYNRSTVESVNNLANVLRIQGKYNEAEQLHRRALQWREEALGSNDPMTLKSMSNLATVLGAQNFNSESESLHQRALEGRELILGPLHLDTLESVNSLAVVTQDQGKYEKAEALYRMALEGRVQILGAQHPDVLSSVNNLATVLQLQGRYEEAEMLHRRALEGREKKLGERHPDTLTSVSNLATVLRDQGNHGEAESLVRKHHEPQSIFVGQASTASGTYIGQSSISFFQNETLVGQEEPTIILKEDAKIPGDSSVASHTTTGREKLGKAYIAHFLAADVEVGVLCCSMLDRVDQEQFVDIGEQMLKGYYLGLLECAKTELEKQGARLLKSGPGRRRICKDIADTIKDENAQNKEEKKRAAEQLRLTEERLEMFTKDSPDTYPDLDPNQPPELEGEFPTDYNDITQSKKQDTELDQEHLESELGSEDEDLPNLTRMKEFFRESEPFQVLLNDLRIQLLPHSLRDIMQTAPHGFLSLSNQDNHSLSNRMKAFIEDFTMLEWNWWPLEPRMRNLNSNETRLFWHCVSRHSTKILKLILCSLVVRGSGKKFPGTTPT
jgi:tetratricopeptide (TPR) repeat protein